MREPKIKTLFIGTSDFAVPSLKALSNADFTDLVGVVTQPDRPAGRKQETKVPAVKLAAKKLKLDMPLYQPEAVKEIAGDILDELHPELVIVTSYGQILPKNILEVPKYKALNIHASLLPDLRGAVPIPMAILKGYQKTGVTIPVMSEAMDKGDIIMNEELRIRNDDTTETLTKRLAKLGADLLIKTLPGWISGEINAVPQDHSKATYVYMKDVAKDKAGIDWNKSAVEIDRMVRAFYPWPVAFATIKNEKLKMKNLRLKVFKVKIWDNEGFESGALNRRGVGQFFKHEKKLFVKCGDGKFLELVEVQLEGRKKGKGKSHLYLAEND